ncbi:hypothetical protein HZS_3436 [Henneguya salminicola]|nr:hypothetical protein HZS_3436 [Henneguya salminicola]
MFHYCKTSESNAIPAYLGSDGKVRYDVLLRQDPSTANKIIHCKYEEMIPAVLKEDDDSLEKPSEEIVQEVAIYRISIQFR